MIQSFSKTNNYQCCGCELCASACPVSIISMKPDGEGFLYPVISDETKCIDCHLCEKNCPINNLNVRDRKAIRFVSAISKDELNIKTSSSGGIATLLSKSFIRSGGVVYGVRYSSNYEEVEYCRVVCEAELDALKTSKYCQSRKGQIWRNIREDVLQGKRVLFIGLPCEIAALNNWLPESDRVFTIELVCHGVTSPLVHNSYIRAIKENVKSAGSTLDFFSVRYKLTGWKPYYILAHFNDGEQSMEPFRSSVYDIAFRYLKRPSCNRCHFKYGDSTSGLQADITLGDNHGVKKSSVTYNRWGSSIAIIHTDKGQLLFDSISPDIVSHEESDAIVRQNLALYKAFPQKTNRKSFSKAFVKRGLNAACKLPSVIINERIIGFRRDLLRLKRRIKGVRRND